MMTPKRREKILKKALDLYGVDLQMVIAIEEMAELTQAIVRNKRFNRGVGKNRELKILEEACDVYIMVRQILLSFEENIGKENVYKQIDRKLLRLDKRMKKEVKEKY